jgi:hypothetical protein
VTANRRTFKVRRVRDRRQVRALVLEHFGHAEGRMLLMNTELPGAGASDICRGIG